MRLLSTDRAELQSFLSPETVPGGYAILSHVWDEWEETVHTIEALRYRCSREGTNPRDFASEKIRQSCLIAESHGYSWIWIDTCCIDKTSSSELSEALNSMFHYYSSAAVCYAYLRDVPTSSIGRYDGASPFAKSRWHTRGWTLQELVAPSVVLFLSSEWKLLASKIDLASELTHITGIPGVVLTMHLPHEAVSVAQRMSWASQRQTTRPEDEAYCLMGLFGINMPTLYGEGRNAFRRLQEEIMKETVDTSLFAWGRFLHAENARSARTASAKPDSEHDSDSGYLFAASPAAYTDSRVVRFRPSLCDSPPGHPALTHVSGAVNALGSSAQVLTGFAQLKMPETYIIPQRKELLGVPTFTTSSYGVVADMPILQVTQPDEQLTIGVLFCDAVLQEGDNGSARVVPLGLLFARCAVSPDPHRVLHHTSMSGYRIIDILPYLLRLQSGDVGIRLHRADVYLAHWRRAERPRAHILSNVSVHTPFRIPQLHLNELCALGLEVRMPDGMEPWWRGTPSSAIFFIPTSASSKIPSFGLHLGRCKTDSGPHWACIVSEGYVPLYPGQKVPHVRHKCPDDHVKQWEAKAPTGLTTNGWNFRKFSVVDSHKRCRVTLSLKPCHLNPETTMIAQLAIKVETGSSWMTAYEHYTDMSAVTD